MTLATNPTGAVFAKLFLLLKQQPGQFDALVCGHLDAQLADAQHNRCCAAGGAVATAKGGLLVVSVRRSVDCASKKGFLIRRCFAVKKGMRKQQLSNAVSVHTRSS